MCKLHEKVIDLKKKLNFQGDICPKCNKQIDITNDNVNEFLNLFADFLSKNEQKYI